MTRYTAEDWRGNGRDTSTAAPLVAFADAISSSLFHVVSCFDLTSFSLAFSSSYFRIHSVNRPESWSEKSFRTFRVRLWTAWFQCPLVFLSSAGKMIGNITLLFCLIKLSIWSLFHKNNARSATWTRISVISNHLAINYIFSICNINRPSCTVMQKKKKLFSMSNAPEHNCGFDMWWRVTLTIFCSENPQHFRA